MMWPAAALLLGVASSLHCVGMCSPLQWAVFKWLGLKAPGIVLYHALRVAAYGMLGGVVALLSAGLHGLGWQQPLSWAVLALMVLYGVALLAGRRMPLLSLPGVSAAFNRLTRSAQGAPLVYAAALGLLNGLLPCGMVLLALAASFALPVVWAPPAFMVFFGLGTVPALVLGTTLLRRLRPALPRLALLYWVVLGLMAYRQTAAFLHPTHTAPVCAAVGLPLPGVSPR